MKETDSGPLWRVFGRVLLFLVGCAVLLAVTAGLASKLSGKWPELVVGALAGLGAFALTAAFVRWEKLSLQDVGAAPRPESVFRLAAGFLIGLILVGAWAGLAEMAGQVRWVRATDVGSASTAIALLAYLALASREELAFRGYPLRRLQTVVGLWPAQLVIAFVFAAEHKLGGASWTAALLGPAVGSILFGMLAISTRGLAVPIGAHVAWNFGQWALGLKGTPGFWKPEGQSFETSIVTRAIYIALFGAATLAAWLKYRRDAVSRVP